jgi:hypothetical protein
MFEYLFPLLALVHPGAVSRKITRVLAWWRPFVTVALCAACVGVAGHPVITTTVIAHLPRSATPEDLVQVHAWLDADLLPRTLLLPVRVGAESAVGGLLLLVLSKALWGGTGEAFKGYFVLSLVGSVIPRAGQLAAIAFA